MLKKHDIVKIVVRQESKSQSNGVSDQERQVDFDAKVDAYLKFNLRRFSLDSASTTNVPEIKAEGQRDFKGTGEFDRSDTFTDRVSAEIIDVKPNGNLVLEARSHMQVDDEKIDVALSGTCRKDDVQADDTVLSTDMADLRLSKQTSGEGPRHDQAGGAARAARPVEPVFETGTGHWGTRDWGDLVLAVPTVT